MISYSSYWVNYFTNTDFVPDVKDTYNERQSGYRRVYRLYLFNHFHVRQLANGLICGRHDTIIVDEKCVVIRRTDYDK